MTLNLTICFEVILEKKINGKRLLFSRTGQGWQKEICEGLQLHHLCLCIFNIHPAKQLLQLQ